MPNLRDALRRIAVDEARNGVVSHVRDLYSRAHDFARQRGGSATGQNILPLTSNGDIPPLKINATLSSSGNTLTLTPIDSGMIPLVGDAMWDNFKLLNAVTLSTAGYTSGRLYDVYLYYDQTLDPPQPALETSIWTNETTRSEAIEAVDGATLKISDHSRRLFAVCRYNGSTLLVPKYDPNGELIFGTGDPRNNVADPHSGVGMSAGGVTFGIYVWQFWAAVRGKVGVGFNALGQLLAAAGNLLIDFSGITLNQAHILAKLSANSNYPVTYVDDIYIGGFHVLGTSTLASGQMRFGTLAVMRYGSNVVANGDFADGALTSWTSTGLPAIIQDSPDGRTYAVSVDNLNYVSQSVATVSGDDYILTFFIKHVSGADVGRIQIDVNGINLLGADQTATNSWIKVVVLFRATASSMAIKAYSQLATGAIWYFTGFDCKRLDTWSYSGDYDSDHLGNYEIQSQRNINIEAKNGSGAAVLVRLKNALTQLQQATPATPAAGYDALYFKSDDKLYKKVPAGTETAFAEGGGTASGTNTGDVTLAGTPNYITIAGQVVTRALIALSHMADVATGTIFYRKTAGTGAPEVQTLATLKTDLDLSNTNSGDVTLAGAANYLTIAGQVITQALVTLANMATVATGTVFYRKTAGTGSPEVQTLATLKADLAATGFLNFPTAALTIASGVVTATGSRHTIDTEAAAATDDLDTINGGATGDILILSSVNNARDVTVKDGTGNLLLSGDMVLDSAQDTITLIRLNATNWVEIARSNNA